ncbi:ricin-type beta-trefoil lectin domain protein [Catenulispora pinisilvae]|uniref:ricin-type beta-trefoil lectin domain protein n=1 Tax=Catenulispora pinisilvae TaxID=2705253 RepID=UPI001891EA33|nr:ricin-type beta-trefoil lectin domain protein [Catenulispora pinisilvae]
MPPTARRRTALATVLTLLLSVLTGLAVTSPTAQAAKAGKSATATDTTITVDGNASGRTFDGLGAISGGGGNSRLLVDYPEPQRSEILDYLFKPGYGASLQILKIEIGGDTNSTDGAEASHEHSRGVVDCNEGYEWWLAEQAKARNPNIKIYGLAWGAPGWINGGFWSTDTVNYLMDWFGCAAQHHLNVDYLGGWNERGYNATFYENLKSALVAHGYGATKVVGADSGWDVADAMTTDSNFNNSVDIVGVHYPCGYGSAFTSCDSTQNALNLNKPLWASENGSESTDGSSTFGAPSIARALNRDYIDGKMTAYINWPLISAIYPNLHYADQGLGIANQPWSGNYYIGQTTWVMAQTSQFTEPGWQYLDSGSGYLGGDRSNGSYVSLKSPNGSDYSTVVETMDATAAQNVTVNVTGGLSNGTVHVWQTNVKSGSSSDWFVHSSDLTPSGGSYSTTLQPGYVYTFSTTTGQGKGVTTPPAPSTMPLPYTNDFNTPATTTSPLYFSDMNGAFQTAPCDAGRAGTCLRQMAGYEPIRWTGESYDAPYTLVGDQTWSNYTVQADTLFEQSGSVELIGRANIQGTNNNGLNAYHLRVSDSGAWSIVKSDTSWNFTTLASGTISGLGLNKWHKVAFQLDGSTLTASVDGTVIGSATDSSFTNGQAGLGVTGYQTDEFSDFSVTPGSTQILHQGAVPSAEAGKCLDDRYDSQADGNPVEMYDCNTSPAQTWYYANGYLQLNGASGKCLDVTGNNSTNGTLVELWDCNAGQNQVWTPQANGELVSASSGKCLDDPQSNTANFTQLEIWDCNDGANQQWTMP